MTLMESNAQAIGELLESIQGAASILETLTRAEINRAEREKDSVETLVFHAAWIADQINSLATDARGYLRGMKEAA